jgi:segregation and condensation protein B
MSDGQGLAPRLEVATDEEATGIIVDRSPLDVDDRTLQHGIEAVLFLADEPVETAALVEAIGVPADRIEAAIAAIATQYEAHPRGIDLRAVAGGWRLYTSPSARPVVERWVLTGRSGRLTQAALETLAVIAYKQPIGRQEIGEIRGVNADAAVRSLVARGLVAEVGRDSGPGQAVLYGTTTSFLERLGLDGLDDLPPLTEFLADAPAPDEPAADRLKDVRRRLREGGELDVPVAVATTDDVDDDSDLLPAPRPSGAPIDAMDDLTGELDRVARSAVRRLRAVVAAAEVTDAGTTEVPDAGTADPTDAPVAEEPATVPDGPGSDGDGTPQGPDHG